METAGPAGQSRDEPPTPTHDNNDHIMLRDQSSGIIELVEHMNEAAGKSSLSYDLDVSAAKVGSPTEEQGDKQGPRRSPRKRPFPQVLGPSSELIKRRQTDPPSSSGRLKRKSLPSQQRPSKQNRDSYEIQVEDSDGAEEAQRAPKAPPPAPKRKQVRAMKKKAANSSPMKGQGEIEMRATSKVNLDDSPSKRPIGRPRKVQYRPTTKNADDRAETVSEADPKSRFRSPEDLDVDETPARQRTASPRKRKSQRATDVEEQTEQTPNTEVLREDRETARRGTTQEEKRKARERKREKDRAAELRDIETISNTHGPECSLAWGDVFAAVIELTEMRNSAEPESERGTRLCRRTRRLADRYRPADTEPEYAEEDLPSITDDIQRLTKSIWRYPENRVHAPNERAKKCRDLYGHVVPKLVRVMQKVLRVRQVDGEFDEEVYDEMCALLQASWNVVDMACEWKPRPSQLDNGVRRLMRDDVRKNLGFLKGKYLAHREDIFGTTEEQRLDAFAEIQQRAREQLEVANRQRRTDIQDRHRRRGPANGPIVDSERDRSKGEEDEEGAYEQAVQETNEAPNIHQGLLTPPSETEILDKFHALQRKNQEAQENARKERWNAVLSKNRRRPETTGVVAATEQAVLDIDDISSPFHSRSERTSTPPRGDRAPTEEIPGPVQPPIWTEQERIVFQNLLQRFTGLSRFEQIMKRYGGHGGLLQRHDLDSLISFVNFLKESNALEIRRKPEEWVWLTGVLP